jgi:hypothetical protein
MVGPSDAPPRVARLNATVPLWDADENDVDEDDVIHATSKASREEKKAIKDLLARLDTHLGDETNPVSKWPRLMDGCFTPNGIIAGNEVQAVVFTEFAR